LVAFYPNNADQRLRFELVALDRSRLGDSATMIEHMRFYQGSLREESVVESEPPIDHPSGATYVGVDKCAECHTKAYDVWKETPHAKAFESLDPVHKRHGYERLKGISRVYDAECLACHVTGWEPQEVLRFKTGFLNEEFARDEADKSAARLLKGNQCENCHGPGSRHVELIEKFLETDDDELRKEARSLMHVSLETAKKTLCYSCHDLDNSPHFEFDKYWEEVKHSGLD
jgi:hypothetical protein